MHEEERYFNRQTLIFGQQTQAKVKSLKVCLCGLSLLGLEIAKNLIMMGVNKIILIDNNLVKYEDALNSFYFNLDDVGQRKAKASLRKFRQLGAFTKIAQATSNDIQMISSQTDVAVVADCWDESFTSSLNQEMHNKNKGFIMVSNLALYGSIFVDFGDKHEITDCTGEPAQKRYIQRISNEVQAYISFANGDNRFEIRDEIQIYCVKGMTEINGRVCRIVKKCQEGYLIDVDSTNFSSYRSGGIAQLHKKKGDSVGFQTLADNLKSTVQRLSFSQQEKSELLVFEPTTYLDLKSYAVFKIFSQFYKAKLKLPDCQEEQQLIGCIINKILQLFPLSSQDKLFIYKLTMKISHFSTLQISPFATFWGGIAAQEVIKFTGKYTPINQWLHYGELDMIVQKGEQISKYSQLFGSQFEENITKTNIALVGGGALGSEIIKIMSQFGMGSKDGTITIIDDDTLSAQNLNRMCLTNKSDQEKKKGALLAEKSCLINKNMNISFIDKKLYSKEEKMSQFWRKQSIIISAVDTFHSRNILDTISTKYKKIMLNGGSENLKSSTQLVNPCLSQNYCASADYEGEYMYISKANHFPFKISQVIQMAIGKLDKYLEIIYEMFQLLTVNKSQFIMTTLKYHQERYEQQQINQKFEDMLQYYQIWKSKSYKLCVELAVTKFYLEFQKSTKDLLQALPEDKFQEGTKSYFWSGLKNLPKIISLDLNDPIHIKFVHSLSTIFAEILNISPQSEAATLKIAKEIKQVTYNKCYKQKISDPNKIADINVPLNKKMTQIQFKMSSPSTFDRNHPKNIHLQFLYSTSVLIARKFSIEEAPREQVEKIACRIAPTVITGIAITAGLLTLQLIKVLKGGDDSYKNSYVNLALPRLVQSSLVAPKLTKDTVFDPIIMGELKCIPQFYSSWQSLSIVGPVTVLQLKQHYQQCLKIRVDTIYTQQKIIYGFYNRLTHYTLNLQVSQALRYLKDSNCEQNPIQICISGEYLEGQIQSALPPINYYLPK